MQTRMPSGSFASTVRLPMAAATLSDLLSFRKRSSQKTDLIRCMFRQKWVRLRLRDRLATWRRGRRLRLKIASPGS